AAWGARPGSTEILKHQKNHLAGAGALCAGSPVMFAIYAVVARWTARAPNDFGLHCQARISRFLILVQFLLQRPAFLAAPALPPGTNWGAFWPALSIQPRCICRDWQDPKSRR